MGSRTLLDAVSTFTVPTSLRSDKNKDLTIGGDRDSWWLNAMDERAQVRDSRQYERPSGRREGRGVTVCKKFDIVHPEIEGEKSRASRTVRRGLIGLHPH